ncbi:MAG: ubiquinol oxidase subunit II [Chlamydiales bacterium]
MKNPTKPVFYMLLFTGIMILAVLIMQPVSIYEFREYIDVLFPTGSIGIQQRNLLYIIQALMLLVITPVYILTFVFSWKYNAKNPRGKYDPDLVDSSLAEYIWWGVPLVMTLIIAVLTWIKSYELDPFRPIQSPNKPKTIQAVALQWKWLFIYPEEKIATLNYLQLPKDTPIHFEITADAPMNALWIPQLGGMIYAMPKMKTQLYLIANEEGVFRGSSANLSGLGFSDMHFMTRASSEEDYQKWVSEVKDSSKVLNLEVYNQLVAPSQKNPVELYRLEEEKLFHHILAKYLPPKQQGNKD